MAKQKKRYSDNELNLIKGTFAENEELLFALRKVFYQMPLDVLDRAQLDSAFKGKPEMQKLLRKTYLPQIEAESPINQVIDLWMTVDFKDKLPHEVYPHLEAREKIIQYIDEQLQRIESDNYDVTGMKFEDFIFSQEKDANEAFGDILARNTIISHNEAQMAQLDILAGLKSETIEETEKRLNQNSSK